MLKSGFRCQVSATDDRGQNTEDRKQKPEDRGQMIACEPGNPIEDFAIIL
jgi:hypothetical protein